MSVGLGDLGAGTLPAPETACIEEPTSSRDVGTLVHSLLEKRDYSGLRDLEAQTGSSHFAAEPLIEWATHSPWMAPPDLSTGRDVWTELAFEVPLGREVLVGSIDRVVKEVKGDKIHFGIIDFKITEHPKSSASLREAYQTQLELYAWALTVLEPKAHFENITAWVIHISPVGVRPVHVRLGQRNVQTLADSAVEIIAGTEGMPTPGSMCRFCDHREYCEDAEKPDDMDS